jgi:hypothetical protein
VERFVGLLIARIDIWQEIQRQETRLYQVPTTEEAKDVWDRIAELIRNHNRLETQARSIGITLRFIEYSDETIFN